MRKLYAITAVGLIFLGTAALTGCGNDKEKSETITEAGAETTKLSEQTAEYQKITAEEAKEKMDSGENIVILDVRTAEEYEEKHIPGAILIPNEEIGTQPLEQLPDLDQEILVYCRSGNRSAQAVKKMLEAGYTKVYDFGGIHDWTYETETGAYRPEGEQKPEEETEGNSEEVSAADGLLGEFETLDLSGETVTQDIFTNADLTMLNIWGTFCGPCIYEMPYLGELAEEYKEQMQMVGLISDVIEPKDETAEEIIAYTGADYLHILNSKDLMAGYLGQVQAVPTTVFLDREGKQVGKVYAGAKEKEKWQEIIEEMLEKVNNEG